MLGPPSFTVSHQMDFQEVPERIACPQRPTTDALGGVYPLNDGWEIAGGRIGVVFGETPCMRTAVPRLHESSASAGVGRSAKAGRYLSALIRSVELASDRT